jgi:hypothetical protein
MSSRFDCKTEWVSSLRRKFLSLVTILVATVLSVSSPAQEAPEGTGSEVTAPPEIPCNLQDPQAFMIRGNYIRRRGLSDEERAARQEAHQAVIRYRTEQYGYFDGFGEEGWNETTPRQNSEVTVFFDEEVRLNSRIIPALSCVEQEILNACGDFPYQPHRLSGLRRRNTFHTGEVSNHVYGIAIDVDPDLNTCCHCTARWREHELCRLETDSIFDRMAMPECWVHAFERYGFYWLGHDALEDTMHFEFLGDPDAILPAD